MNFQTLEKFAQLEHDRWSRWHKWCRDNWIFHNIERWNKLADTPYSELSEELKQKDRDKVQPYIEYMQKIEAENADLREELACAYNSQSRSECRRLVAQGYGKTKVELIAGINALRLENDLLTNVAKAVRKALPAILGVFVRESEPLVDVFALRDALSKISENQ